MGNAIVDVIAHVDDAFLVEHGLTKGSMQLVDAEQAEALYDAMPPGIEASGGSAANTVAGVASLGGRPASSARSATTSSARVSPTTSARSASSSRVPPATDGPPTARSLILVTPDAERTMNTFLGIAGLVDPADVDVDLVACRRRSSTARATSGTSSRRQGGHPHGMDAAADGGPKVAFDAVGRLLRRPPPRRVPRAGRGAVDILFANEAEICSLYEVDALRRRRCSTLDGHVRIAFLTRGRSRRGRHAERRASTSVPAAPVEARWSTPRAPATSSPPASCTA